MFYKNFPRFDIGNNSYLPNLFKAVNIDKIYYQEDMYDTYYLKVDDRFDNISYEKYGKYEFAWIILLYNGITNTDEMLPKFGNELEKYMKNKIKDLKTNTDDSIDLDDSFKYSTTNVSKGNVTKNISYRDYYIDLNEKKKIIKLPKKEIIDLISRDLEKQNV